MACAARLGPSGVPCQSTVTSNRPFGAQSVVDSSQVPGGRAPVERAAAMARAGRIIRSSIRACPRKETHHAGLRPIPRTFDRQTLGVCCRFDRHSNCVAHPRSSPGDPRMTRGDAMARVPFDRLLLGMALAVAALDGGVAVAQHAEEKPFVEKVEVRVRSVLVFITDRKGKALTSPPLASQLRVTEKGVPVEIVGVEPARRSGGGASPHATVPSSNQEVAASAPTEPSRIPQY